jgi:hypothetical protein
VQEKFIKNSDMDGRRDRLELEYVAFLTKRACMQSAHSGLK